MIPGVQSYNWIQHNGSQARETQLTNGKRGKTSHQRLARKNVEQVESARKRRSFIVKQILLFSAKAPLLNDFFLTSCLIGIDEMEMTALAYLMCCSVCG